MKKPTKKEIKITYVEHPDAKSIVFGWFRQEHPRLTDEQLLATKTDFNVLLGERIPDATVSQVIEVVKRQKNWAYCKHVEKKHKEIHYWFAKTADHVAIFETIAHEVAHAFGYSNETTAQKMGAIAAFTYKTFMSDFALKYFKA